MKKLTCALVCAIAVVGLSSCYNTRIISGTVSPTEPLVEINKVWNHHFIYGLIPGGNATMKASEYVDDRPNYVVRTNTNILNYIVSGITFGIYTPTQTKYFIPLKEAQIK